MKIQATSRLTAYDRTWVKKMDKETDHKYQGQQKPQSLEDEQIFKLAPSALAQRLRSLYKDDFKAAMSALTGYKNRAGKNLMSPDKDRLEKAKEQLRKLYGKDKPDAPANKSGPKVIGLGNT